MFGLGKPFESLTCIVKINHVPEYLQDQQDLAQLTVIQLGFSTHCLPNDPLSAAQALHCMSLP